MNIVKKIMSYNTTWNIPGKDSRDSMPIGNGDLTANVWAEADGTVSFYIGKSDTWSETTQLLKVGKVKIQIFPNPFEEEKGFLQTLKLKEGEIEIRGKWKNDEFVLRIWADANYPAIRVELSGSRAFKVLVTGESLRKERCKSPIERKKEQEDHNNGFFGSPVEVPEESADAFLNREDHIGWYHRNRTSPYRDILAYENAGELFRAEQDPYLNRTFGACIKGLESSKFS